MNARRLRRSLPRGSAGRPIYLEHGRLEVDDSSVKWMGADGLLCRIPVATVSSVLLGPGTTVTHAAMRACAESNTPVCWIGEEGMRFYAFGLTPNHTNDMPRLHAAAWADKKAPHRDRPAHVPDAFPRPGRGESFGQRAARHGRAARAPLYAQLGLQHGVTWKGRNYDRSNWEVADEINRAVSAANASLYSLCAAVICSLGYVPSLGFVHDVGTLPFVYDVADLYKHLTSIPAAFLAVRQDPRDDGDLVRKLLKQRVEEERILQRMPRDLAALFGTDEALPVQAGTRPPSALA